MWCDGYVRQNFRLEHHLQFAEVFVGWEWVCAGTGRKKKKKSALQMVLHRASGIREARFFDANILSCYLSEPFLFTGG